MKKRNKKYNPKRGAISASKVLAKKYMFACVGGKDAEILTMSGKRPKSVSEVLLATLLDLPHKWNVLISVIMRAHDGSEYVESRSISFEQEVKQADVSARISDEHAKLVAHCKPEHFVNVGWIGSPSKLPEDLDDGVLYDKMGAFKTLAKWEADRIGLENCEEIEV